MFVNLTELTYLGILFHGGAVTSIVPFTNAFDTLTKVTSLVFYGYSNPFTNFCMANSFKKMTSLKALTFEMGPTFTSSTKWNTFGVVHDTLESIRYVVRPYLRYSTELYKNLPNLKRAEMMFRGDYDYNSLKHCAESLKNTVNLDTFYIYSYGVSSSYSFTINNWGNLFTMIKDKIKRFEIIIYNSSRAIDIENLQYQLNESKLPNLESIKFQQYKPHTATASKVPVFKHTGVTALEYLYTRKSTVNTTWNSHKNLVTYLPSLKRFELNLSDNSLSDSDMNGFGAFFQSLQGRILDKFVLQLYSNDLNSMTSYLQNTNSAFQVVSDYAYFDFR